MFKHAFILQRSPIYKYMTLKKFKFSLIILYSVCFLEIRSVLFVWLTDVHSTFHVCAKRGTPHPKIWIPLTKCAQRVWSAIAEIWRAHLDMQEHGKLAAYAQRGVGGGARSHRTVSIRTTAGILVYCFFPGLSRLWTGVYLDGESVLKNMALHLTNKCHILFLLILGIISDKSMSKNRLCLKGLA